MGGKDGVLPFDTIQGGRAVVVLLEAPAFSVFVEKLQVRLMYNSMDTLMLRLHFYEYDSVLQAPAKELLTKEIFLKETSRFGWLRSDLKKYDITLNVKKFFVGFEWIETHSTRKQLLKGLRSGRPGKRTFTKLGMKRLNAYHNRVKAISTNTMAT